MSEKLLGKTRKLNRLLQNSTKSKVIFTDVCRIAGEILNGRTLVISRKGKILGAGGCEEHPEVEKFFPGKVGELADSLMNDRLLAILVTRQNADLATLGCTLEGAEKYDAIISPIIIAGERLGTLLTYGEGLQFGVDDVIISEYASTVVGVAMRQSVNEENAEENRKKQIVRSAISTLSFSEMEAIVQIFRQLNGNEGILVASRIADQVGITRSVIVNALRKFESAGVIESRSSGMRGTSIKVLNDAVFDEIKNVGQM